MNRKTFVKQSTLSALGISLFRGLGAVCHPANAAAGFLSIKTNNSFPGFDFFSIDSLGKNKLSTNVILKDQQEVLTDYKISSVGDRTLYHLSVPGKDKPAVWEILVQGSAFTIISNYQPEYKKPFIFNISQLANHATLLGIMKEQSADVLLPAILHFPDMGSLRVTCTVQGQALPYDAKRYIKNPYVRVQLPAATQDSRRIEYRFEVVSIHPEIAGIDQDERYDCFRRNFISIFQLNPFLKILANNSASDACAFTLYEYAEVALHTPPLADGLTALDLIRATLDRYLAGQKGYGLLGYDYDKTWDIPPSADHCDYLDAYPSLLMSACNYVLGSKDEKWFRGNQDGLKRWTTKMLATDQDDDGLLEFCLSGNSGSWKGDKIMRPANWWDTIGFGHKDAYSNALAYRALLLLEEVNRLYGQTAEADLLAQRSAKLKNVFTDTFYNPSTGVLAGWKSADGQLHDYYFTFVSGVAISYGLIAPTLANSIMDKLLLKMKEVGFQDFSLGLPGNLIPVIRADYTDLSLEAGGGQREDNQDGFQIYENGGATACFTYFTIHALQQLGRKKDADSILRPLLKSMSDGNFQGSCANGRTRDWKTWKGDCWGYEGFLVDNYMFLLCVTNN